MSDSRKLESLITLYLDPDPKIRDMVQEHLLEYGESAVPAIDQARSGTKLEEERDRLSSILYELTFPGLVEEFAHAVSTGVHETQQLEEAVCLLSRLDEPTFRTDWIRRKLDYLAGQVRPSLAGAANQTERMEIFFRHLFQDLHFQGDRTRYHDPENGLLHRVIDRRKGIPLTLSLVVLFLAQRLDLPFHGVNMPIHFLLMFDARGRRLLIDPFDEGAIITLEQCHTFLRHNKVAPRPEFFEPCPNREILARHLRNLKNSYEMAGDDARTGRVLQLMSVLSAKRSVG